MVGYGRGPTWSALPVFPRTDVRQSGRAWTQDNRCASRDSICVPPEDESSLLGGLIGCEVETEWDGTYGIGGEGESGLRTLPDKLNLRGSVDYISGLENTVQEKFC